jgi:hypothetical protein
MGLLRGTVMIVAAVVVGTVFAVNVLIEGVADVLTRSPHG